MSSSIEDIFVFPVSYAQQRLWFLDQWEPGSSLYNMALAVRLEGALDVAALAQSLATIVQRHEALRTTFESVDGEPQQVIAPELDLPLLLENLADLPAAVREDLAVQLATEEARRTFDLASGPLLRTRLLRLAPQEHALLVSMHHIIADGWSLGVFMRELSALYIAAVARQPADLPDLPIQYADYALWQRDWLQGAVLERQLDYWRAQLAGAPAVVELPTDFPRPAVQTFQGASQSFLVPPALHERLRHLSQQAETTMFMTLLAAFQVLLARYSGQDDIVVGAPIAGRTRPELEHLIGFFANTLVLRADLRGDPTFSELLGRVREVCLGAYAHQDLPFERLVEELHPTRNLSHAPLVQVTLVLQNAPMAAAEWPGVRLRRLTPVRGTTAKFDLTMFASEDREGLLGSVEYNSDLFTGETIARLLGHFQTLLSEVVVDGARRISCLPLLTDAEQQLIAGWNATTADYPRDACVQQLFEAQVARAPDAVAVVYEDRQLTYAALNTRANQLAYYLRSHGVGPDTLVGLYAERSLEVLIGILGILKAGGAYVPLDPTYPPERLAFMLADTQAPVLITTTDQRRPTDDDRRPTTDDRRPTTDDRRPTTDDRPTTNDQRPTTDDQQPTNGHNISYPDDRPTTTDDRRPTNVRAQYIVSPTTTNDPPTTTNHRERNHEDYEMHEAATTQNSKLKTQNYPHPQSPITVDLRADWDVIARQGLANPAPVATAAHRAYVIYTSGSTGRPKGVMVVQRGLINLCYGLRAFFADPAVQHVGLITSISFDISVNQIFPSLLFGRTLHIIPETVKFNSAALLAYADTRQLHILDAVPSYLYAVLTNLAPARPPNVFRHLLIGGEKLEQRLLHKIFDQLGAAVDIVNIYGLTEISDVNAFAVITAAEQDQPVTIGQPLQNNQLYILNPSSQLQPIGVVGEVCIAGESLSRGYLNRPDLAAEKFQVCPFGDGTLMCATGDAGKWRADGRIELLGRLDHQVKIRGFRIEVGEIEAVLAQHAAVREVVVLAREDTPGDTRLVAYVVPRIEDRGLKIEDSSSEARDPLSSILYPLSSELRDFLKNKLPDYMVPAVFVWLDALPHTPNGKVDRKALPAPDQHHLARESAYAPPQTPVHEVIAGIWQEVLRRERIGIHDNFFALGGHSLLATQLTARVRTAFGVDLPLRSLFEYPTIAALTDQIMALRSDGTLLRAPALVPSPRDQVLPLSFAQQRLWFLDQLDPGSTAYMIPIGFHVYGALQVAALQESLSMIVLRHEVLRTTFRTELDQPAQVIAQPAPVPLMIIDLLPLAPQHRQNEALRLVRARAAQPFDLARGPLFRVLLLRLTAEEHMLLLTFHHSIFDAWSAGVFLNELTALYTAATTGIPCALPELPIQYADYAIWQRQWLQGSGVGGQGPGRQGDKETRRQGDKEPEASDSPIPNPRSPIPNPHPPSQPAPCATLVPHPSPPPALRLSPMQVQLAYWQQQLADLPVLQLPADFPRPAVLSDRGASLPLMLPAALSAELAAFAQQEQATLFMTLLAAFQVLLARYSGQDDLAVGSPIANRDRAETKDLIGFFVNTLVLRTNLAGAPSFRELLQRVRRMALDAYAHQHVPFEQVVDALQPARGLSHNPLFQVMFTLEHAAPEVGAALGLTTSWLATEHRTAPFDLTLSMRQTPDGLVGALEHSTDLFTTSTIARMLDHFQTLLAGIVAQPDHPIHALPLLSAHEQHQLLVAWNDTHVAISHDQCLHQLFEAQVLSTPDAVAVVFDGPPTTDHRPPTTDRRLPAHPFTPSPLHPFTCRHLTYAALDACANRLAHALHARGVGPGACVALCLDRSLAFLIGLLGILKTGATALPLDAATPSARLAAMLADAQVQVLLTTTDQRPTTNDQRPTIRQGDKVTESADDVTPSPHHPFTPSPIPVYLDADWPMIAVYPPTPLPVCLPTSLPACVFYTSGSTGAPKGVVLTHQALVQYTHAVMPHFELRPGDRMLQFAALGFDVGIEELFPAWSCGATVVLAPSELLAPAPFGAWLDRAQVTVAELPVAYWHTWVDAIARSAAGPPRSLRLVLLGCELPAPDRIVTWQRWDVPLLVVFGLTETAITSTLYSIPAVDTDRRPVPIGRPIANTQVYLLDALMQPVPIGVPGDLYIGGAGLAQGYLNRPDLTAERFIPNPFGGVTGDGCWVLEVESSNTQHPTPNTRLYRTGDRARYRADGNIEFLGRSDEQVKVRGYRIELGEVATALERHPAVHQAVVLAREDRPGAKRLVAYIVPDQRPTTNDQRSQTTDAEAGDGSSFIVHRSSFVTELRAFLQTQLPEYMVPAVFVVLEALPLTASGKVDRAALPAPAQSMRLQDEVFSAPLTPVEATLAQIWADVLGLEQVGSQDNFFALGGDSILSIQIIARAHQAGLRLTPQQVFQHQTIATLAAVAVAETAPAPVTAQGLVIGPVPLTPIQHWFFALALRERHHWNQSVLLAGPPNLAASRLAAVVAQLLRQHDALRLRFTPTASGWRQHNAGMQPPPIIQIDLRGLTADQQPLALAQAAAMVQASLDLTAGPLLRVALIDLSADQPVRVLIAIHHLAVDDVSWGILLEDLLTAYEQLCRGLPIAPPPKTTSFQQWAEHLAAYAQTEALHQELPFWLTLADRPLPALPVDHAGGANTVASARTVSVTLSANETESLLRTVPPVYRTQITDVLLTAVTQAFAAWTGQPSLLLELEGHGREALFDDVDLTRTVGWFTVQFPLRLDLPPTTGAGAALQAVKEQLRRVPRHGIGYGVLRYLAPAATQTALRALLVPQVLFNYAGQFDRAVALPGPFGPAPEPRGPNESRNDPRTHLIEINAEISAGQLRIHWTFSPAVHTHTTVSHLAQTALSKLQALIAHCLHPDAGGVTPSDFPLAALDQLTLNRLVGAGRLVEDIYPLSPLQHGMLFHSLYAPGTGMYVAQQIFHIADLDVSAFQHAWQHVVNRHPILRTAFVWQDLDQPLQIVQRQVQVPWTLEDWRGIEPAAQQDRLDAFLAADRLREFALDQAPLLRMALFQLTERIWSLVWSEHSILLDGWSGPLVIQDVLAAYAALAKGQPFHQPLPRPFREYIVWLQQQDQHEAELFWRRQLAGLTAPTPLIADRTAEPGDPAASYAAEELVLAMPTSQALLAFARQHGLTLNTLVQGAWALLLSRYSGEQDVLFGTTVAGRPPELAGVEDMVGLFINTLPVRVSVAPEACVPAWLQQLQAQQATLRQYAYSPLPLVQSWSEIPRGSSLFESLVVFENYPVERRAAEATAQAPLDLWAVRSVEQTNYPLTLVAEPGRRMPMQLMYARDRFSAGLIRRMLGHLQTILEGIAADPQRPVVDLPLLTASERQQLLVEWNRTGSAYPHDQSIHHLFEAQATRTPDAIALVFEAPPPGVWGLGSGVRGPGDKETRRQGDKEIEDRGSKIEDRGSRIEDRRSSILHPPSSILHPPSSIPHPSPPPALRLSPIPHQLTYAELNARANRLAHYLRRMGVGPEVCVGLYLERSLALIVATLSVLKAGGAYVPLDPAYPPERLAFMLADARVALLLTQQHIYDLRFTIYDFSAELKSQNSKLKTPVVVCLDAIEVALAATCAANLPAATTADNLAYVMYTSGSTGRPKGVAIPHRAVIRLVKATSYAALTADAIMLHLAPSSFDAATFEVWGSLLNGARLVIFPAHTPSLEELGQVLDRHRVTVLWLTAGLFHQMVAHNLAGLRGVRQLLAGGDSLVPAHVQQALRALEGCTLINGYGPTENTTFTCCHPMIDVAMAEAPIAIGRPIANTTVYVLDRQLRPVPIGIPGELYAGGDGLARGYLNEPGLTAAAFIPNPFAGVMGDGCWVLEGSAPVTQHPTPVTRLYRTGDLARYRPDGVVEFLGRADQQVKIRGYRIEPGEIEAVLAQHPTVQTCAVLAREDVPGEKRLVAYVVPKIEDRGLKIEDSGSSARDPLSSILYPLSSDLRDFLKNKLPDYMIPSAFVILDALPLTSNGKVDRRALPHPDRLRPELDSAYTPPQTPTQAVLADIWRQVLGLEQVGIHDNFFALGGHSLLAIQLTSRIHQTFGKQLALATLIKSGTIAEQATLIQQADAHTPLSSLVQLRPGGSKRPLFCIHPKGGHLLCYVELARLLETEHPIYGLQAQGLDTGEGLHTSIEAMAAYYIDLIRDIQREGPYLLCGYSLGGLVAFEMAQQLQAQGQQVDLLALLDCSAQLAHEAIDDLDDRVALVDEFSRYFPLTLDDLKELDPDAQMAYIMDRIEKFNLVSSRVTIDLARMRRYLAIGKTHLRAALTYAPRAYQGRIALFRCDEDGDSATEVDPTWGWRTLAWQGLDLHLVPGSHLTMLEPPHVYSLIEHLQTYLARY